MNQRDTSNHEKKRRNKLLGTNYERRVQHKGVYGFRRWGSLGTFDVGKLDYIDGKLCFLLIQNKFSTKKRPYISKEELQRISGFIQSNELHNETYPWLWIGYYLKQKNKKEERVRMN